MPADGADTLPILQQIKIIEGKLAEIQESIEKIKKELAD
jgi:hypothetical protein